jgi:thioredoxin 1
MGADDEQNGLFVLDRSKSIEDLQEMIVNGPTAVKFWAPWCGPCRALSPTWRSIIPQLFRKYEVKGIDINTDEHQQIAINLGVQSLPCTILFKNGEQVERIVGSHNHQDYEAKIKNGLKL